MDCNKRIYDLINALSVEQNIVFALSCIKRTRHLPKFFINSETFGINYLDKIIPKDTIENILNDFIEKIHCNEIKINEIDDNIKLLEKLLLDDEDIENGIEKQLFFWHVIMLIHTLEYIKDNKTKFIEYCSDDMITIINYNVKNPNCSDEEMEEHIDLMIDEEVKKEIEIIKIIQKGNKEKLNEYIRNNGIEYNV